MKVLLAILIILTGTRAYSCNPSEAFLSAQKEINSLVKDDGGNSYSLGPFVSYEDISIALFTFRNPTGELVVGNVNIDMQTCDYITGGHAPVGPPMAVK